MTDCKPMATPMVMNLKKLKETSSDSGEIDPHLYKQLIGSLMYLVNTRPDICYEVSVLSQFMSQSRQTHWIATKHVLRYLLRFVYLGKCSPCVCELLNTCGKYYVLCALYFMSNFILI
jgi:hypothetical protein